MKQNQKMEKPYDEMTPEEKAKVREDNMRYDVLRDYIEKVKKDYGKYVENLKKDGLDAVIRNAHTLVMFQDLVEFLTEGDGLEFLMRTTTYDEACRLYRSDVLDKIFEMEEILEESEGDNGIYSNYKQMSMILEAAYWPRRYTV